MRAPVLSTSSCEVVIYDLLVLCFALSGVYGTPVSHSTSESWQVWPCGDRRDVVVCGIRIGMPDCLARTAHGETNTKFTNRLGILRASQGNYRLAVDV